MSKLSLDLMLRGEQIVIDLPAPISTCFLELGPDINLLSLRNLWNEGERISRTKSYRRAFCTKIEARFSIGSSEHAFPFDYIGSGANRVVFRNNQLALKISTIPVSKQCGRSWDDPTVSESKLIKMGIVGILPILLEGQVILEETGELYFYQCQPFADMTLDKIFQHMVPSDPQFDVDLCQLMGFLFFVLVNIIHIFRENSKLNIVLGDITTRNVSLAHGALKIIDWECSYILSPDTAGFAARSTKFLTHLLTDVAAQLPSTSNVQPSLVCVSQALSHAWTSLRRGGSFGRLLDTTWGVESILSIFNSSLPLLRARLMALPNLPWCFGEPGRSTRETILAIEDQVEPFQTPTVPVLSTSCVPSNPAHYKKKSVSHPTYWHSNRKQKQRENRRIKRRILRTGCSSQAGSSRDKIEE